MTAIRAISGPVTRALWTSRLERAIAASAPPIDDQRAITRTEASSEF